MHRTLKAEATRPPEVHARAQQRRFDAFRREYNTERPDEALAQATPASCYAASPRPYPRRLPPLEYPAHWEVRRVSRNGSAGGLGGIALAMLLFIMCSMIGAFP